MYFKIKIFCDNLSSQFNVISKNRKNTLENIANYITLKQKENKPIHLVYICTHNSRRSQFGQIWSRVAADYYQILIPILGVQKQLLLILMLFNHYID